MAQIAFIESEFNDILMQKALDMLEKEGIEIKPILSKTLEESLVTTADAYLSGLDFTTREVVLAARDKIGMTDKTFSSSFVIKLPNRKIPLILADAGVTKNPTVEQLADIILQTSETAEKILKNHGEPPKIACLSFSTAGSGGRDASIDKIHDAIKIAKSLKPEIIIDGEMQLDAAMDERIGKKKFKESKIVGQANVLICPDLNSGNILYKSLKIFGNAECYGPILQGFKKPVGDLSRGSSSEEIAGTIKTLLQISSSIS